MRARIVDWSLLALTLVGIFTGLWSFLVGDSSGQWLFVAHGALGLAVLGVLAAKVHRVTPITLARRQGREDAAVGVLTALVALATVGIGVWWVVVQSPVAYPNGMIWHTTLAFVLLGLCLWHLFLRYRPLAARDVRDRRSALRLLALLAGGGAVWAGIEGTQAMFDTPGKQRRFTGSRRETGLLVTMWMLDRPDAIDVAQYTLQVGGAVAQPMSYNFTEVAQLPQAELVATLDCTGGWYSEQRWRGIQVSELLARAMPTTAARYVRFRSITGYRWSLPLAEAADALLALEVAGARLEHGNGAPLRLVAPGRRGFQWVKWVVAVEVLDAPDRGQWAAIFTSGLDGV